MATHTDTQHGFNTPTNCRIYFREPDRDAVMNMLGGLCPEARVNKHGWVQWYNSRGDLTPFLPLEWQRYWYMDWLGNTNLTVMARRFEELVGKAQDRWTRSKERELFDEFLQHRPEGERELWGYIPIRVREDEIRISPFYRGPL